MVLTIFQGLILKPQNNPFPSTAAFLRSLPTSFHFHVVPILQFHHTLTLIYTSHTFEARSNIYRLQHWGTFFFAVGSLICFYVQSCPAPDLHKHNYTAHFPMAVSAIHIFHHQQAKLSSPPIHIAAVLVVAYIF